jgi:hypothetical protein
MIVFSKEEFQGMHIDSIIVGTTAYEHETRKSFHCQVSKRSDNNLPWCLLCVVMFMHIAVNSLDMQGPVQRCVEKVKDNEEYWQWKKDRAKGNIVQLPQNIGLCEAVSKEEVNERTGLGLADANEKSICTTQVIQMLSSYGNLLCVHPLFQHIVRNRFR